MSARVFPALHEPASRGIAVDRSDAFDDAVCGHLALFADGPMHLRDVGRRHGIDLLAANVVGGMLAQICPLLQRHQNASVFEQRCASLSPGSADRIH